ncbi:MAG: antibiotic biosynthesis monooxygenase [Rhizobiaceae bacterium]|nr:antibiotic biosynthesis monooxygenase [Rhizobiaceae bacterium]
MYVAMNRFQVPLGREEAFEAVWRERRTQLPGTPGFIAFRLLRGSADEAAGVRLYISHSTWEDHARFKAWTVSAAFRAAHRDAGGDRDLYAGPPRFEGFEAVEGVD